MKINLEQLSSQFQQRLDQFKIDPSIKPVLSFHEEISENDILTTKLYLQHPTQEIGLAVTIDKIYFSEPKSEQEIDRFLKKVLEPYFQLIQDPDPVLDFPNSLTSYSAIKNKIFLRLRDPDYNQEADPNRIQFPICQGLHANARVGFWKNEKEFCSTPIDQRLLDTWNIDKEHLYEQAMINLKQEHVLLLDPRDPTYTNKISFSSLPTNTIYALSTINYYNGASVILVPSLLASIAQKLNENFYLLPSSINDIMLVPRSFKPGIKRMRQTLLAANKEITSERDFLSNKIFYYDSLTNQIECVHKESDEDHYLA